MFFGIDQFIINIKFNNKAFRMLRGKVNKIIQANY